MTADVPSVLLSRMHREDFREMRSGGRDWLVYCSAMGRIKEFNPDKALGEAVELFWTKGYARTSLDELMQAMGIARQSLYDTFGDKRQLYLRALKRYRDELQASTRAHFPEDKPVRNGFRALLTGIAQQPKGQLARGCLLLSASEEREDEGIAELLVEHQKTVESIFREAIERAQKSDEISRKKDAGDLARFFVGTIEGMHAVGRVQAKRKVLDAIAETALSLL